MRSVPMIVWNGAVGGISYLIRCVSFSGTASRSDRARPFGRTMSTIVTTVPEAGTVRVGVEPNISVVAPASASPSSVSSDLPRVSRTSTDASVTSAVNAFVSASV